MPRFVRENGTNQTRKSAIKQLLVRSQTASSRRRLCHYAKNPDSHVYFTVHSIRCTGCALHIYFKCTPCVYHVDVYVTVHSILTHTSISQRTTCSAQDAHWYTWTFDIFDRSRRHTDTRHPTLIQYIKCPTY